MTAIELSEDDVLGPAAHVESVDVDAEVVLYDPHRRQAHLLNPSAAAVWHAVAGGARPAEVVAAVSDQYGVDAAVVTADVGTVLGDLVRLCVLEATGQPDGTDQRPEPTTDTTAALAEQFALAPMDATGTDGHDHEGAGLTRTHTLRALDLTFTVASDDPEIVAYLDGVLASLATHEDAELVYVVRRRDEGGGLYDLRLAGGDPVVGVHDTPAVLSRVLWDYNHRAIRTASADLLLHAAAVVTPAGVIVLPAPAESGKSTLVAGLTRHGYGYVTDECAAVDGLTEHRAELLGPPTVRAYPKPIGLDPGSWPLFGSLLADDPLQLDKRWLPGSVAGPGALAAHPAPGARLPLAAVVFPRHEAGAATELVPLGPGAATVTLARNAFRLDEQPQRSLAALAALATAVPAFTLAVDDLAEACATIDRLVDEL